MLLLAKAVYFIASKIKYPSIILLAFLSVLSIVPKADTADALRSARIVNGNSAAQDQFPYQVNLRSTDGRFCGGSIISTNYVLTAAHCVEEKTPEILFIRVGSVVRNSGGTLAYVSEIKVHPKYKGFNYDVALLKLTEPLTCNNLISSIPLETGEVPSGAPVTLSGWGSLYNYGPLVKDLQFTTMTALDSEECSVRSESTMCLGHVDGNGGCDGDSGGPAVYNDKLAGVFSYLVHSCESIIPNGFTNVSFISDWIRENAELNTCA